MLKMFVPKNPVCYLTYLQFCTIAKSWPQGRKIAGFGTTDNPAGAFNVQHHLDQDTIIAK
jgi:hypothetical protein